MSAKYCRSLEKKHKCRGAVEVRVAGILGDLVQIQLMRQWG